MLTYEDVPVHIRIENMWLARYRKNKRQPKGHPRAVTETSGAEILRCFESLKDTAENLRLSKSKTLRIVTNHESIAGHTYCYDDELPKE